MALFTMLKVATALEGTDAREFVHIIPELTIPVGHERTLVLDGRLKNSKNAPKVDVKIAVSGNLDYGFITHRNGGMDIGKTFVTPL